MTPLLRTIARTTAHNLLCGAMLATGFFGVHAVTGDTYAIPAPESVQVADPPTKAQRLVDAHDCDLPANVIPGHAVVTVNGRTWLAGGERGFAIWLGTDGIENTADEAPGVVHAFCA